MLPKLATLETTGKLSSLRKPARPASAAHAPQHAAATQTVPAAGYVTPIAESTETQVVTETLSSSESVSIVAAPVESVTVATATESAAASEPSTIPLWKAMRNFTRERIVGNTKSTMEDNLPDYSALLEEEIESVGFPPDGEEAAEAITANVTRLRSNTGG